MQVYREPVMTTTATPVPRVVVQSPVAAPVALYRVQQPVHVPSSASKRPVSPPPMTPTFRRASTGRTFANSPLC